MIVTYKNTYKDLFFFMHYTYTRSLIYIGVYFLCALYISYSAFYENYTKSYLIILILTLLLAFIFHVITLLLGFLSMISKKNKPMMTEHTIILEEDFLKEITEYGNSEFKWHGVQKPIKTKNYIYIYVSKFAGHIIPLKAFNNDEDIKSFFKYCEEHVGKEISNNK
jgi:hypothetical protein